MEPDRYQNNHSSYIIALSCLLLSMASFGTGAFILPHIAFGLKYTVPNFVFNWANIIQQAYGMSEKSSGWMVVLILFLLGFVFSIVTYVLSNRIEHEIYDEEFEKIEAVEEKPHFKAMKESGPLILRIIITVVLVFIFAKFFQWAISSR